MAAMRVHFVSDLRLTPDSGEPKKDQEPRNDVAETDCRYRIVYGFGA